MFEIIANSAPLSSITLKEILVHYFVPLRGLSITRHNNLIILPDNPCVREFKSFYEKHLNGGKLLPCLWTRDQDFCMDIDIANDPALIQELVKIISQKLDAHIPVRIRPYSYNELSRKWIDQLIRPGVEVDGDSLAFAEKFREKSILHQNFKTRKSNHSASSGIRVPKGYYCNTTNDLKSAYSYLSDQGIKDFFLKPVDLSAGEGIMEVNGSLPDVKMRKSGIIIEEKLIPDINRLGLVSNCSIEFSKKKVFGLPSTQLLKGFRWNGNLYPAIEDDRFIADAVNQAEIVLRFLIKQGMQGPGGLDFMSMGNKAYLIDNNLARMTGTHFPKEFQERFAPNSPFAVKNFTYWTKSIDEIWESLVENNLQFSDGTGIFPIVYLKDAFSTFISFESDPIKALENLNVLEGHCL
jgi:hypothetical protein